jgi:hypothetical protein
MQQQIDQPRGLVATKQILQQLVLLRPDAGQGRNRRKQGIEQTGAHTSLFKRMDCRAYATPKHPATIVAQMASAAQAGQARQ